MPRSLKTLGGIFGNEDFGRNFIAGVGVDNLSHRGCVERLNRGRRKQMEATPAIRRVLVGKPYLFSAPDDMKMFEQMSGGRTSFYWGW